MRKITWILLFVWWAIPAFAQKADPDDPANVEKGKKLLQQVIEARGGAAFLGFKSIESTGLWSPYEQGASTIPIKFEDYIVYPDKERTEFGKGKKKDRKINVNVGTTGWVYDGDAETLKDQNEKQVKEFQESRETDIDMVLRAAAQDKTAEVRFYGREETRPGERADVIMIKLKRTFYVQLDPYTKLPTSMSYEKAEEQGTARYEYRFNQYVPYDGVKFPNIVDLYRNGLQISRVNYQTIKLNTAIPETLFAKPANAKAIK
ncbi:MAG TPA: hypothetical protein VFZ34_23380 [Blastocatellia bacterium]|nr:hypothetical protein [Blastocatellia bacterium]